MKPEYYIIKKDTSNPLWKDYIGWLNKEYKCFWGGFDYKYYGYCGSYNNSGTNCYNDICDFPNNPTLLTLEEWEQLFILSPKIHEVW